MADVVMVAIGLIGMLLLFVDYDQPVVRNAWKFVSVALVIAQLYLNLAARAKHFRDPARVDRTFVRVADLGVILFLLPSLGLNLAYAFGG